jgi:hypothetical protein
MRTNQLTRRVTMATIMTAAAFLAPRTGNADPSNCCINAVWAAQARCPGISEEEVDCYGGVFSCSYTAHCDSVPFWGGCVWSGSDFTCC